MPRHCAKTLSAPWGGASNCHAEHRDELERQSEAHPASVVSNVGPQVPARGAMDNRLRDCTYWLSTPACRWVAFVCV